VESLVVLTQLGQVRVNGEYWKLIYLCKLMNKLILIKKPYVLAFLGLYMLKTRIKACKCTFNFIFKSIQRNIEKWTMHYHQPVQKRKIFNEYHFLKITQPFIFLGWLLQCWTALTPSRCQGHWLSLKRNQTLDGAKHTKHAFLRKKTNFFGKFRNKNKTKHVPLLVRREGIKFNLNF
jgi:hypothetical protein